MERTLFEPGFCIEMRNSDNKIEILEHIGSGGTADIYRIRFGDDEKILKWYNPSCVYPDCKTLCDRINDYLKHPVFPIDLFNFPIAITPMIEDSFGIVLNPIPSEFRTISDFLIVNTNFKSFKTCIDALLNIAHAFRLLHNTGYAYRDINPDNILVNPDTGNVIIRYNEEIAPGGEETYFLGTPRYMAPEVVCGDATPNSYSDRFSMAVILFQLLCQGHPLEGERSLGVYTPELQARLYGKDALFIFDRNDYSNAPHVRIHAGPAFVWRHLPDYVKEIFYSVFEKDAGLHAPAKRPTEADWISVLTRFRSDIVSCSCGNEVFTSGGERGKCEVCGADIKIPFRIVCDRVTLPGVKGTRIYRHQAGTCDAAEALYPFAIVLNDRDNPEQLVIKNLSGYKWLLTDPNGEETDVMPGETVPLADGVTILCNYTKIYMVANSCAESTDE